MATPLHTPAPTTRPTLQSWLQRESTCLLLAPHHDVGLAEDQEQQQMECLHHGDPLVPRQQRFGEYTRSLLPDVTTLNFHPHLPHYELTAQEGPERRVLGRHGVDRTGPIHSPPRRVMRSSTR